jgi:hypothetical protein
MPLLVNISSKSNKFENDQENFDMILKLYVFYVFVKVNSFTIHVVKTQKCQCSTKITSIFLMLCIRLGVRGYNV